MNLNPLKKDDNTDALVKALEDANNVGAAQPAVGTPATTDIAAIAADPQVVSAGVIPDTPNSVVSTVDPVVSTPAVDSGPAPTDPVTDATPNTEAATEESTTDTTSGVSFDGNDLPEGMSSDADAHLETTVGSSEDGELDTVKKSALEQLRPLIEKLDLEPADKFDKYLMMLRASDDPALIKPAFDAAQGIEGEKEKAQALLDIINEINYITANQQQAA